MMRFSDINLDIPTENFRCDAEEVESSIDTNAEIGRKNHRMRLTEGLQLL
jgi:hypothetical protein